MCRSIADLIFRFIDADGSGQINADELGVAFAHLGIEVMCDAVCDAPYIQLAWSGLSAGAAAHDQEM